MKLQEATNTELELHLTMNADDSSRLINALRDLPLEKLKARTVSNDLFWALQVLKQDKNAAIPELARLHSVLSSIDSLKIFDGMMQPGPYDFHRLDYYFLAYWVISRVQVVGVESTVADLERYLIEDIIPLRKSLAVDGLRLNEPLVVDKFTLLPWGMLPMSDTKWNYAVRNLFGMSDPSFVICETVTVQKKHISWQHSRHVIHLHSLDEMMDLLRCITLIKFSGHRMFFSWFEPPEWAPRIVRSGGMGFDANIFTMPPELTETDLNAVRKLYTLFRALGDDERNRLVVSIDRLNNSILYRHTKHVDSAIDLGLALETAFCPREVRKSIQKKIVSRAKQLVGGSSADVLATGNSVKKLYDLRSSAVHRGAIVNARRGSFWADMSLVDQALEDGHKFVACALARLIIQGTPPGWI